MQRLWLVWFEVTRKGYATDIETCVDGVQYIPSAIYDEMARVTAGLSVPGPGVGLTKEKIEALKVL